MERNRPFRRWIITTVRLGSMGEGFKLHNIRVTRAFFLEEWTRLLCLLLIMNKQV